MKPRYVPQITGAFWLVVWTFRAAMNVLIVAFALALAAYLTSLLGGCGASPQDHATTALAAACDAVEQQIEDDESDPERAEARVQCVYAVCETAMAELEDE